MFYGFVFRIIQFPFDWYFQIRANSIIYHRSTKKQNMRKSGNFLFTKDRKRKNETADILSLHLIVLLFRNINIFSPLLLLYFRILLISLTWLIILFFARPSFFSLSVVFPRTSSSPALPTPGIRCRPGSGKGEFPPVRHSSGDNAYKYYT